LPRLDRGGDGERQGAGVVVAVIEQVLQLPVLEEQRPPRLAQLQRQTPALLQGLNARVERILAPDATESAAY
jgi:hypothetical protein